MRVRCVLTDPLRLPEAFVEAGFTRRTQFHVAVGRVYTVVGVGVVTGAVCYLILDDTKLPSWTPAVLFEVIDSSIGPSWAFVYFHRDSKLPGMMDAMMADAEIALDEAFPDALMNRVPEAIERFATILGRQNQGPTGPFPE